jgi:CHAT domain-containing protein/tetratricopeptide (TPR) repeat protein
VRRLGCVLALVACFGARASAQSGRQPAPPAPQTAPPAAQTSQAVPQTAQPTTQMPERDLSGGEIHTYTLQLSRGQFVRAVFDQRGVDLLLTLKDAQGQPLFQVDHPVGSWGPEPLFFETEQPGTFIIEVRPRDPNAPPGRYAFTFETRYPTRADRSRFAAERTFAQATQLLQQEQTAAGLDKFREALRLFRQARDARGEGLTLTMLGAVAATTGDAQTALSYFADALERARAAGDTAAEASTLGQMALVYHALGDHEHALEYFQQALAAARRNRDDRAAAYTLVRTGLLYEARNERPRALETFQEALPLFRLVRDKRGEAYTLNNLGVLHDRAGQRSQAHEYYDRALALFREVNDCHELAAPLSNLALEALDTGDEQKAVDYLTQALDTQRSIGDRQAEATTLNNLGFVYNATGRRQQALGYFAQALALHRALGNTRGEGDTYSNLMFAWRAQRPALAAFYGKQAVNDYQQVRRELPPLDREAQLSFIKSKALTYRQLAELLIERGRLPEAQQVLSMLKEEEYLEYVRRDGGETDALAKRAALTPAESEMDKRYQEIAGEITVRGRQRGELLAKSMRTAAEEKQLASLEMDLNVAGQAFQKYLDQLAVDLENSRAGAEKVYQLRESQGLMEDLRELGQGAVALYTVAGEDKYRVILITPDVQKAAEYPIRAEELNRKIAAFREALQDYKSDPRPLAQELYKIIVGPIAKDLQDAQAETLMWSLDGALRYVPVAALHDGQKYMVERYRNVVFTPASTARLKDQPSAQWRGLGFGVSKALANFPALPAVPAELRGIFRPDAPADGAPAPDADGVLAGRVLLDDTFNEESFRGGLRQRVPVVHIASHFAFQPGNETDSFLLLGDGQRLTLAQLKSATNLFGGVELLTLSACDTASGGAGADGKEVEGFAVLAQRQGAKAVIASLWPVADASTRLLMQNFYRQHNAQPGMPKVEALRQAQLSLLRGGKADADATAQRGIGMAITTLRNSNAPFAHPYFWAPFILIGNWR